MDPSWESSFSTFLSTISQRSTEWFLHVSSIGCLALPHWIHWIVHSCCCMTTWQSDDIWCLNPGFSEHKRSAIVEIHIVSIQTYLIDSYLPFQNFPYIPISGKNMRSLTALAGVSYVTLIWSSMVFSHTSAVRSEKKKISYYRSLYGGFRFVIELPLCIIHFSGIVQNQPTILGYLQFRTPPNKSRTKWIILPWVVLSGVCRPLLPSWPWLFRSLFFGKHFFFSEKKKQKNTHRHTTKKWMFQTQVSFFVLKIVDSSLFFCFVDLFIPHTTGCPKKTCSKTYLGLSPVPFCFFFHVFSPHS